MTKLSRLSVFFGVLLSAAVSFGDVVVLKGGVVINLKKPPAVRGDAVLLTRMDGTLLSVPASEIDREATAAARAAGAPAAPGPTPAPPMTLAGAARAAKEVPKARVRITDADVSHIEATEPAAGTEPGEAEKGAEASAGSGRVEVSDYTQEKSGDALVVRGALRNPGGTPATSVRMTVTALDPKGQTIASTEAGISSGSIEPSKTVAFSVTIPIGARTVASLRFVPRWISPALPAASKPDEAAAREGTPSASSPAAPAAPPRTTAPPAPAPTPYGRGSLYAPPAPNAPSEPSKDGKTGYLPGPSHPSNQPKPPS
jgi:hypothetical protein